jgi:hypothetical protein
VNPGTAEQGRFIQQRTALLRITAPGDGTLELYTGASDDVPIKFVEIGPQRFHLADPSQGENVPLVFTRDRTGRVKAFTWRSEHPFEKVPWYERIAVPRALLRSLVLLATLVTAWGTIVLLRRWDGVGRIACWAAGLMAMAGYRH